jgi:hypothetical protein
MEYIIVFVIGFALGWYLQSWLGAQAFYNILKDLDVPEDKIMKLAEKEGVDVARSLDALKDVDESTVIDAVNKGILTLVIEIKVESVEGRLMAYRADDELYLAQGNTAEELVQAVLAKYPTNSRVEIVEGGELVRDYVDSLKK